jgi:hypothetical protein
MSWTPVDLVLGARTKPANVLRLNDPALDLVVTSFRIGDQEQVAAGAFGMTLRGIFNGYASTPRGLGFRFAAVRTSNPVWPWELQGTEPFTIELRADQDAAAVADARAVAWGSQ